MSQSDDQINPDVQQVASFVEMLRVHYINSTTKPTIEAAREFDDGMRPLIMARMAEIQREQIADQPTQAQILMELLMEIEQVITLVPPRLRQYRELLAAEGLDKTVVPVHAGKAGRDPDELAEGGREGLPGINLADQAALEFHSQLLHLALGIAQDEVQQRLQRQGQLPTDDES